MGVSLKPSDAVSGGIIFDDVDLLVKRVRFRLWDYNGQIATPVLGLAVLYEDENDGTESEQVYSAGDTKFFVPSDDGSEAVPVGSQQGLQDSTNAMAWMVSLVNAGFPEDKITDKVTVFEGTRAHVKQQPQPKRKGLAGAKENKNILLVSKINSYPWDKVTAPAKKAPAVGTVAPAMAGKTQAPVAHGAGAGAASGQGGPSQASASTPVGGNGEAADLNTEGVNAMLGILAAKGGTILKTQIAQEAFKVLASHPMRNQLVQLVYNDAFLKSGPWAFDGTTVSFGG